MLDYVKEVFYEMVGGEENLRLTMGARRFRYWQGYHRLKVASRFYYISFWIRGERSIFPRRVMIRFWAKEIKRKIYIDYVLVGFNLTDVFMSYPDTFGPICNMTRGQLHETLEKLTGFHPCPFDPIP